MEVLGFITRHLTRTRGTRRVRPENLGARGCAVNAKRCGVGATSMHGC